MKCWQVSFFSPFFVFSFVFLFLSISNCLNFNLHIFVYVFSLYTSPSIWLWNICPSLSHCPRFFSSHLFPLYLSIHKVLFKHLPSFTSLSISLFIPSLPSLYLSTYSSSYLSPSFLLPPNLSRCTKHANTAYGQERDYRACLGLDPPPPPPPLCRREI